MAVPPTASVAALPPGATERLLEALHEVDGLLLGSLPPDEVLAPICRAATSLLRSPGGAVVALDPDGRHVRPLCGCGLLQDVSTEPFPREGSLAALALSGPGCVIENDLPSSTAAERTGALAPGATRALVHVLAAGGEPVGALLCLRTADDKPFTEVDSVLLEAFARRAALAIEMARVRERDRWAREAQEDRVRRQRDRIRRLEELHRAGMAISSDMELEDLLGRVVEEARHLCRARYGALGILSPDGSTLSRFLTRGLSLAEERRMEGHPTGRGLLGAVIREGGPVRVDDPRKDPRSTGVPSHHPHPGPFLGVPIRIGQRIFGNLYLMGGRDDPPFDEDDERVLEMLGSQAAAAIENARLFAETRRLVEELERARRVRNRLQAYVSHDLRNALTGVTLWAERLERSATAAPPPSEAPVAPHAVVGDGDPGEEDSPGGDPAPGVDAPGHIAARIRRGAAHALRLVKDVLDLSRLEDGTLQTWPRRVVVADLLSAAVDHILPEAERRGVRVRSLPQEAPLHLVADQDRVLQVILNLLSNAVRVSPRGSRVELSARPARGGGEEVEGSGSDAEGVAIQVRDEGPGIEVERLEALFGATGSDVDQGRRGSGIGLPLSVSLARHMGGALTAESTPGEGSTFTLWLPSAIPEGREGWIG